MLEYAFSLTRILRYQAFIPHILSTAVLPLIQIFYFLHKVRVPSNLKIDRTVYFLKNLVLGYLVQKGRKSLQIEVF